jgi:hypothetical protein
MDERQRVMFGADCAERALDREGREGTKAYRRARKLVRVLRAYARCEAGVGDVRLAKEEARSIQGVCPATVEWRVAYFGGQGSAWRTSAEEREWQLQRAMAYVRGEVE